MIKSKKKVKYPENLPLRGEVMASGWTITELAQEVGVSRLVMSQVLNGHYKGQNIVPKLKIILGL